MIMGCITPLLDRAVELVDTLFAVQVHDEEFGFDQETIALTGTAPSGLGPTVTVVAGKRSKFH